MVISGIRSREKFILMDGKYDYALSSSGAVIVYANDMTSETYHPRVSDPAARHFWNIPWNIMKQMRSFLPSSTSLSDVGQSFYDATMTQWTLWVSFLFPDLPIYY